MAWTRHGHQIPGTPADPIPDPHRVARCGGTKLCQMCKMDAAEYYLNEERTPMPDNQLQARILVVNYYNDRDEEEKFEIHSDPNEDRSGNGYEISERPSEITIDDVFVVWFTYTLGNWKCVLSTVVPDDLIYEVTYNAAKKETYIDVYRKIFNRKIADDPVAKLREKLAGDAR